MMFRLDFAITLCDNTFRKKKPAAWTAREKEERARYSRTRCNHARKWSRARTASASEKMNARVTRARDATAHGNGGFYHG